MLVPKPNVVYSLKPKPLTQKIGARFQVLAFDYDDDALTFRMGTADEYGGITRSTSSVTPFATDATTGRLVLQDGPYACEPDNQVFLAVGRCPNDRGTTPPPGNLAASFTNPEVPGMVEWAPWVDDDGDPRTPVVALAPGLYNFVVVVTDGNGATAQADFLVYLYLAPVHFCSGDCARAEGTRLPAAAGMPTFADPDGVYGRQQAAPAFNQRCAICGAGAAEDAGRAAQWCTPGGNAGGACAAVAELSPIVGDAGVMVGAAPPSACRRNNAPVFVSDGTVGGVVDTPGVEDWVTSTTLRTYAKASMRGYYGRTLEFYVTAQDDDDCTEVSVDAVRLPVSATTRAGLDAELVLTSYEGYGGGGRGGKTRRRFSWPPPPGSDPITGDDALDDRPALSEVTPRWHPGARHYSYYPNKP
jgi:hypothetical protein